MNLIQRASLLSALFLSVTLAPVTHAGSLSAKEQAMVDWIDAHQDEAIELLAETVNIGSGTMNHAGVRAVGEVMSRELEKLGLATRWIDMPPEMDRAGHLFASKEAKAKSSSSSDTSIRFLSQMMNSRRLHARATLGAVLASAT